MAGSGDFSWPLLGSLTCPLTLSELFHDHYAAVHAYFLMETRDPLAAEELAQETFFQVCRSFDTYRGEGTVKAWVAKVELQD